MQDVNILEVDREKRSEEFKKLKIQLQNALQMSVFCGLCVSDSDLTCLEDTCIVNNWEGNYITSMKDVLSAVFGDQIPQLILSENICKKCTESVLKSYTFIYNTRRNAEIINLYLDQMNTALDETEMIDNSNITKNPNTAIILQDPVENNIEPEKEIELNRQQKTLNDGGEYICHFCNKTFIAKRGIAFHMKAMHSNILPGNGTTQIFQSKDKKKRSSACPECNQKNCVHEKYIISYKKQKKSGINMIKCVDCDYECSNKRVLIGHVNREHLKAYNYECKLCSKLLYSKSAYHSHIQIFHKEWHFCIYCDQKFKDLNILKSHTDICNLEDRLYKCDECLASFDTHKKLVYHKKRHSQQYPCNLCLKVLTNENSYKQHMEMHSQTSKRQFICSICDKTFPCRKERDIHIKQHSPNEKPYCNVCELECSSHKHYLWHKKTANHIKKLHPNNKFRHQCQECDYSTNIASSLEAHTNRYHLKITPYSCDMCPRKFTGTKSLEVHLKSHKAQKKQCELCGKHLGGPTALKRHMRLHSGEKPYLCPECPERFISSCMKQMHIRKCHSVKNVTCPLCEAMFYTLSHMRSHVKQKHWKLKGEKFDVSKLIGLKEEHYDLFRDRRLMVVE